MGLRTTRAFAIGGRRYRKGDPIALTGQHLRLFQALGFVEYGPEEYPPAPAEVPPEKPRRTYRRRDMKAEGGQ